MINSFKNVTKAILIVLPLLFQSCKVDIPKDSKTILKLEKSKCYGDCPVYSIILKEKKWVEFYPKANTKIKKPSYTKIKNAEFKNLINIIESISVKDLKNVYDNKLLMDAPTTYLTFHKGKKKKRIKIRANAPKKLKHLINTFEKIIKSSKWKPLP
jgi:predicted transcriptional regulator